MGRTCSTNGGEEECIYVIGGKARRKETTGKTKMSVGGQYQNGSLRDRIVWYGLD
jgi:hypothetical protein